MNESEFFFGKTATPEMAAPSQPDDTDQRLKIISVSAMWIVSMMNWSRNPTTQCLLSLPQAAEIPPDCQVVSVMPDWFDQTLHVMIRHPSFEPLPLGMRPPIIGCFEAHACWRVVPNPSHILERVKDDHQNITTT